MTCPDAQTAETPTPRTGSGRKATASRRAGGPAQSTSKPSAPAGKAGLPLDALIFAKAQTATTKGLRSLYRRQHQILAKGV